jgi:hypothetical protein
MYLALHYLLITCYKVLPILAGLIALARSHRSKSLQPLGAFIVTCMSAIILGTCVVLIYAVLLRGGVQFSQVLTSWYFVTSLLLIIAALRWAVRRACRRFEQPPPDAPNPRKLTIGRAVIQILQPIAIACIAVPFLIGTMLVNRVRVRETLTPQTLVGCFCERVTFQATDDITISGWWTPAQVDPSIPHPRRRRPFASRTVLICGGLTDDLTDQAGLVGLLARTGYNVLFINLRGHDESGGQWTTFGDLERRDILGAVRWLKQNHPADAKIIDAVGGGIGGAAVIAAATDSDPLSEQIDSVAVLGTFARFDAFAKNLFNSQLPKPVMAYLLRVMLPIASANTGSDLQHFAPAELVSRLWPRPILIIQGRADALFLPGQGQDLFDHAVFPKRMIWLSTDHAGSYHSRTAAEALLDFLDHAKSLPVI